MSQNTFKDNVIATIGGQNLRVSHEENHPITHIICLNTVANAKGTTVTGGTFMNINGSTTNQLPPLSKKFAQQAADVAKNLQFQGNAVPVFFTPTAL